MARIRLVPFPVIQTSDKRNPDTRGPSTIRTKRNQTLRNILNHAESVNPHPRGRWKVKVHQLPESDCCCHGVVYTTWSTVFI